MTQIADRRLARLQFARDFLTAHPEFHFDVQEHLLATEYADALARRMTSFASVLDGSQGQPEGATAIIDAIRSGGLRTVPAYRDIDSATPFERLPTFDREALTNRFSDYLPHSTAPAAGRYMRTSGTSGRSLEIPYDLAFYFDYLFLTAKKVALSSGLRLETTSHVFCLAIDNSRNDREFIVSDPIDGGLTVCVIIDEARPATCARLFSLIGQLQPLVITTRPSIIEALIGYAAASGTSVSHRAERVLAAGSFLSPSARRDAESLFAAPVTTSYGLSESGLVGFECVAHTGYHVDATSVFVEIVDSNGDHIADGREGEIVVSGVENTALPLIRYRTGDFGSFHGRSCECGSTLPRLNYVKGRQAFHFRFSDGARLHPARLDPMFWLFPLDGAQIIQTSADTLEVHAIVRADSDKATEETLHDVETYVRRFVSDLVSVIVTRSDAEPSDFTQRYLTRVKA